jgi:hypothetical protein
MATMLQKARNKATAKGTSGFPQVVKTNYTSLPVDIPDDFLAPVADPSTIEVNQIDFATSPLPEYKGLYAVVLDNVMSEEECKQLIHMTELSAGGHSDDATIEDNGWRPAMVNAGRDKEFLSLDYRNSDRIIWDNEVIVQRLWTRIMQAEGMKDYFSVMKGKEYFKVVGDGIARRNERWVISPKGPNERMRFLKYGAGQFFRRKSSLPFK